MRSLKRLKDIKRARIGLYSAGLYTYWEQFEGLYDCLTEYNKFIEKKLSEFGEVFDFGMDDTEDKGRKAGEFFNAHNVDIVFSHAATYYTSACVLPVHQICKAPVIILKPFPHLITNGSLNLTSPSRGIVATGLFSHFLKLIPSSE